MSEQRLSRLVRLRQLEDRFAIQDLVATYCRAIDDRDVGALISLFTVDGRLRHPDGTLDVQGREALRAYYAQHFSTSGVTSHSALGHTVVFESLDEAHGILSQHAEMDLNGDFHLAAFRCTDRYQREHGQWRFAERVLARRYDLRLAPHA